MTERIPDEAWQTIVDEVPIIAVDLVVHHNGGILLGKRRNEPAKGEWFVPGGRLQKQETLTDAVHRLAKEELGVEVNIDAELGVFEHHYDTADVPTATGKHYVPVGYEVTVNSGTPRPDDQHGELNVFDPPFTRDEFHEYVVAYFEVAGLLEDG